MPTTEKGQSREKCRDLTLENSAGLFNLLKPRAHPRD